MEQMQHKLWQKLIAWILSACLVVTLVPEMALAAQPEKQEDAMQSEETVPAEETAAEETFTERDIVEKSETTTTYALKNGERMTVFHGGAVRCQEESGDWVDYDPSLKRIKAGEKTESGDSLTGYRYRNTEGESRQYLPQSLSEQTPILMENGDYRISFTPIQRTLEQSGVGDSRAELAEERMPALHGGEESLPVNAVYGEKEDAVNFTYTSTESGIKETITLNEKPESGIFEYRLNAGELKVRKNTTDEGLTLYDGKEDRIAAAIEAPWMQDAGGAYSEAITYTLTEDEEDEGEYRLRMSVDEDWLNDEARQYPVIVDPTATWIGNDELRDTYVISGSHAGTNFYDSGTKVMPVGANSTGRHRTYIKFLNLKAEMAGKSISDAKLTLYQTGKGATGQSIKAYRITEDWTSGKLTWNNKPANASGFAAELTTTATAKAAKTMNLTYFTRKIADGTNSNYGIVLQNMTTNPSYAEFYGSRTTATAYRPKLAVTWHEKPASLTSLTVSKKDGENYITTNYHKKGYRIYASWKGITSYSLAQVQYRLEAADTATPAPKSIGTDKVDLTVYRSIGVATASGTNQSVGYAAQLPEGAYRLYVRGKDAAGNCGVGKYRAFYVDGTAPSLTGVKASPATSTTAYTKTLTPKISWNAADKYFSRVTVSVDGKAAVTATTAAGAGSYTLPSGKITTSGTHTIKVTAYDKAGNSKSASLNYYVDIAKPEIKSLTVSPQTVASKPSKIQTPKVSWTLGNKPLASLTLYVNGKKIEDSSITKTSTSYTLNKTLVKATGAYAIKLKITDSIGNTVEKTVNYHCDIDPPQISRLTITPGTTTQKPSANQSPKISWTVTDQSSDTISYSLDQETWTTMGKTPSGTFTVPSTAWTKGAADYTIHVKATDKAGNDSGIKTLTYHLREGTDYVPTGLQAAESYGKRTLVWELDAYNDAEAAYDLHRSTQQRFTPSKETLIAENIDAAGGLYIDNEILEKGTYYYKIVVKDKAGEAADQVSSEASIANEITEDDFGNTLGNRDYLSYTSVELPTGTANIEESSGNLVFAQNDFDLSNAQLDYGLNRTYNGQSNMTAMTGKGWMDSWHKELYRKGDDVYFLDSDGSAFCFRKENAGFSCAETKDYALEKTETGYTITTKEDHVYTFNLFGQLTETAEPNGCSVENLYDDQGRLITVVSHTDLTNKKQLDLTWAKDSPLLASVKDPAGTEYTFTYDGNQLTKVTARGQAPGESVSYEYGYGEKSGALETIRDGEGNQYAFTWSSGKVAAAAYPDGEKLQFTYGDGETEITKKTPEGQTLYTEKTAFDPATGKILSHTDPKGAVTSYEYMDSRPYLTARTRSVRGYETITGDRVVFHERESVIESEYTYDEQDNIKTEKEADGSLTTYTYDSKDNVTSEITTRDGTTVSHEKYGYDEEQVNLVSEIDVLAGDETDYDYDEDGNETDMIEKEENIIVYEKETVYDEEGNIAAEDEDFASAKTENTYAYDAMGREIKSVENGTVTETDYDFLGRVVKSRTYDPAAGKETVVLKSSKYNRNGSLVEESGSDGITKRYTYDSRNRNITETTQGSDMQTRTRTVSYGYQQNVEIKDGRSGRTESAAYTETVKDTAGTVTAVTYTDMAGQTIREVAGKTFTDYTYDKSGNQTVEYTGSSLSGENNQHRITLQVYDETGNLTAQISQPGLADGSYTVGANSVATYSVYDVKGNLVSETDGEGVRTKYTYDEEGRITAIDLAATEESAGSDLKAEYAVLGSGNTKTVMTDANGNLKIQETDAAGNVVMTEDSDAAGEEKITVRSEYDEQRRPVRTIYSDGSHVEYAYDGNSERVISRKAYNKDGLESTVETAYDENDRPQRIICRDAENKAYSETKYEYDAEGKETKVITTLADGSSNTIESVYDSEGRLTEKKYPAETGLGTVTYAYDSAGRPVEISGQAGIIREYEYNGLGQVSSIRDHNKPGSADSICRLYSYDAQGRTTTMEYRKDSKTGTVLESFQYGYDKNDNIVSRTHVNRLPEEGSRINETRQYEYDDQGNLTQSTKTDHLSADTKEVTSYTYDAVGNRTGETVGTVKTDYEYNGLNQLLSRETENIQTIYTYDARGNQILEETAAKAEDTGTESGEESGTASAGTEGKAAVAEMKTEPVSVSTEYAVTGEMMKLEKAISGKSTLVQENGYNQDGQRISKSENGTTRNYYYDNGAVAYTKDGDSVSTANVLNTEGAAVGTFRGKDWYSYLKDVQASTSSIMKEDGSLAAAYDYTDFGETEEITGGGFDNEICYTGAVYDMKSGLYYLNARYYDPENGRFISQDSYRGEMDDPGQWHLYAYCANNPVNYVDPSGHKVIKWGANWQLHDSKPWGTPEKGWSKTKKSNRKLTWKKKLTKSALKAVVKKGAKSVIKKLAGKLSGGAFGAITGAASLNRLASNRIIIDVAENAPLKKGKRTSWITVYSNDVYSTSYTFHWIKIWAKYYKNSKRTQKAAESIKLYLYERMGAC